MGFFTEERKRSVFDIECYRNYFLIMFKTFKTGKVVYFEMHNDRTPLDVAGLREILKNWRVTSFNGNHYDVKMLGLALTGATNSELKDASDWIINTKKAKPWEFRDTFGVDVPEYLDHIDLIEPAPSADEKLKQHNVGLKKYAARMHFPTLQDLPIPPDHIITDTDAPKMREYCENDCSVTIALANMLEEEIALREKMSDEYGVDLRSKSDAQVAEAVFKAEYQRITGKPIKKPQDAPRPPPFKYTPPEHIEFQTPELQQVLVDVRAATFSLNMYDKVDLPPALHERIVHDPHGKPYKMGIGGLHSMESRQSIVLADDEEMFDWDVTGFYPKLLINSRLFPKLFGAMWRTLYRKFYYERVGAKVGAKAAAKAKDWAKAKTLKVMADMFKILLNGTFGKLGSFWSPLFEPEILIWTTLTGQLSLFMLIEGLCLAGMRVVSANTDGITVVVKKNMYARAKSIITDWEWSTNLETEEAKYTALYTRDVNNYFAVKDDGEVKGIGIFKPPSLRNDPDNWVTRRAVIDFLTKDIPLEETIRGCTDIREFISIAQVGGGAEKDGLYMGKIARWYMGTNSPGPITYVINGNRVGGSDGGQPAMVITKFLETKTVPDDIDYDWYLQAAHTILDGIGYADRPRTFDGRTGRALARLPDAKNIHTVDLGTYRSLCGRLPDSRMDRWVEVPTIPDGHRYCAKCRKSEEL